MSLLNLVVFPLLQMNEEEQIMFEDVSEEFLSLHEDCADQQQFYVLKTEAAKLLEFICD